MHIVLANQWFPPESGWGGVAMYNHVMARALRRLGHHVTVIAARASASVPARQEREGITIHRLLVRDPYRLRRMPGLGRYVRPLGQVAYAYRLNAALRRLHRAHPADVVEFADVNAEGWFYARQPETAVVVRCHTPNFVLARYYTGAEAPYDTSLIGRCEHDLIQRAHELTAPSGDMARTIAQACTLPAERFHVIPNPLEPDWHGQTPEHRDGPPLVLHVGRLERAKGALVLAEAIPRVLDRVPEARFAFIGDERGGGGPSPMRAELERCLAQSGVNGQVSFLGIIAQGALGAWYRRAAVCVVPSLMYESFSYTCAQALAAGRPVVASRIGGIPETVTHGEDGLLVPPGDPTALADALAGLLRDRAARERMGQAGRANATRRFDPCTLAKQTLHVYDQARTRYRAAA